MIKMLKHAPSSVNGHLLEVNDKGKFQTFCPMSKSGHGHIRDSGGRLQEVPSIVI